MKGQEHSIRLDAGAYVDLRPDRDCPFGQVRLTVSDGASTTAVKLSDSCMVLLAFYAAQALARQTGFDPDAL